MSAKPIPQVQFLMSDAGERTAAVIPIEGWEAIAAVYRERIETLESIRQGMAELIEIKAGRTEAPSIENLWDELDD